MCGLRAQRSVVQQGVVGERVVAASMGRLVACVLGVSACASALAPQESWVLRRLKLASASSSRREALAWGGLASLGFGLGVPGPSCAIAEDSEATFVRASYGGGAGSVEMPSTWKRGEGTLVEPVLGPITDSIRATSRSTEASSIDALGKVDKFPMATLGMLGDRAKGRAAARGCFDVTSQLGSRLSQINRDQAFAARGPLEER